MNENRKAPAPPRRKRRRRPGKFRRALHALSRAVLLLLLTAAAIVMMTIFFKVNTISVEGAEKYSVEEITNALDISKGDNLYLWNKMKVQEHLLEKLPYLDSVRIRRHLPDALVLTVTECHAAAAVKAEDGSYYNISPIFQIMDTGNIKNVVFRQDDILRSTIHNGFNVNRDNFSSKILTLTIKDSTVQESITRQALGFVHQFTDGIQFTV